METTQWFAFFEKPTRVGVYQRLRHLPGSRTRLEYAYWSGRFWYTVAETPAKAYEYYKMKRYEDRWDTQQRWRGLTKETKVMSYWNPSEANPWYAGVYRLKVAGGPRVWYAYWDRTTWSDFHATPTDAFLDFSPLTEKDFEWQDLDNGCLLEQMDDTSF